RSLALGGPEAVKRQRARGRLTVRERVARLVEPGSFMELGMLARSQDPALDATTAADGLVTGFGKVNGLDTAILAEDATVLDNTDAQVAALKRARLLSLTARTGWPLVFLADRGEGRTVTVKEATLIGGAARQEPEPEVGTWPSLTVVAVMGNCFGPAATLATAADFLVLVKGASLRLAGSGGQGDPGFHVEATGLADRVARDDPEALAILREFMSYLPANTALKPPRRDADDSAERPLADIAALVPEDLEKPYDVAPVIQALVDQGSFFPLKPDFGTGLVAGLARLNGHAIGVAASQPLHGGALDGAAIHKALRLARLCRRFRLPLLFIQDTPGYAEGSAADQRDLLAATGELVRTIKELPAPKLVLVLRRGHVLGDFVLGGRKLGIDYIAAWPLAELATTEPVSFGAAAVPPPAQRRGPWTAAGLAMIEDVLEPPETRRRLVQVLEIALLAREVPAVPPEREAEL
ncbi:MAG: hypothetical protein HY330_05985, partial [Chloroflexi bacterium]|nr:hypothetical protein [Chloroflexota bacterium]